jgi:hypothetical protein
MTHVVIHPRIYQLDELISDVYNFVYRKSEGYKIKFIDISNLKLERFKLTDYNLDTIFSNSKIQYIGSFPTGIRRDVNDPLTEINEIRFKRQGLKDPQSGEHHHTLIRIVPYPVAGTANQLTNPINVNLIMRTLLSELVLNERTNNIILPIINIDINGSDLTGYQEIKPHIDPRHLYSIQITEKFYQYITLDQFLKSYPLTGKVFRTIIYQAIDALYQISLFHLGFRYNQFIPPMIGCYLKNDGNQILPELKLAEFYLSEITNVVDNDYLDKFHIPIVDIPYADLYQLLNYLWNNYRNNILSFSDVNQIFNILLPEAIRSSEMYLTDELWNKLSAEQQNDLKIHMIRNINLLNSNDSLRDTSFTKTKFDEIGRITSQSLSLNGNDASVKNVKKGRKKSHHINIMKNKQNSIESTEVKSAQIPSRIVNIGHHKEKSYKGKRVINNIFMQDGAKLAEDMELAKRIQNYQSQESSNAPMGGQQMPYGPMPLKMNSLGEALGANTNDIQKAISSLQMAPTIAGAPLPQQLPMPSPGFGQTYPGQVPGYGNDIGIPGGMINMPNMGMNNPTMAIPGGMNNPTMAIPGGMNTPGMGGMNDMINQENLMRYLNAATLQNSANYGGQGNMANYGQGNAANYGGQGNTANYGMNQEMPLQMGGKNSNQKPFFFR